MVVVSTGEDGMKIERSRQSPDELALILPIRDLVAGWYFRCTEESPGQYVAEGRDEWGRRVVRSGENPELVLSQCAADARQIQSPGCIMSRANKLLQATRADARA
jgi:hypothetical protein